MQYQIILLPQDGYWNWVRACKDYVLTYGVQLTPDPSSAAAFRAPRQVVTFPLAPGGFLDRGDIEAWFRANHPEVDLDPIEASDPEQLEQALAKRLKDKDRFGRRQGSFYLLWPTQYPVITQKFGANPQIYRKFGFPGHEGVDFRALPNTKIFACADGEVYQVHTNPKSHAYGIHVRIRHAGGYRTVYGHLAKALVSVGQSVKAGQVIGAADSTGASVGSHLHLSLKRDYATQRGETNYPKDVIDPTGLLVWPDSAKTLADYEWFAGRCLIGAFGSSREPLGAGGLEGMGTARFEAVRLVQAESKETVEGLRALNPACFMLARLTAPCGEAAISAGQFRLQVEAHLGRLYRLGVRHFEVHTNPNLQFEGWGHSWADATGFARWFTEVVDGWRGSFSEARFGFPGVSPGGFVSGQRADALQFLEDAAEGVQSADWVGVNCYWTDPAGMDSPGQGRFYEEVRLLFPDRLLFITEFGNTAPGVGLEQKARQYLDYYRSLREAPGIGAAFAEGLPGGTLGPAGPPGDLGALQQLIGRRAF